MSGLEDRAPEPLGSRGACRTATVPAASPPRSSGSRPRPRSGSVQLEFGRRRWSVRERGQVRLPQRPTPLEAARRRSDRPPWPRLLQVQRRPDAGLLPPVGDFPDAVWKIRRPGQGHAVLSVPPPARRTKKRGLGGSKGSGGPKGSGTDSGGPKGSGTDSSLVRGIRSPIRRPSAPIASPRPGRDVLAGRPPDGRANTRGHPDRVRGSGRREARAGRGKGRAA